MSRLRFLPVLLALLALLTLWAAPAPGRQGPGSVGLAPPADHPHRHAHTAPTDATRAPSAARSAVAAPVPAQARRAGADPLPAVGTPTVNPPLAHAHAGCGAGPHAGAHGCTGVEGHAHSHCCALPVAPPTVARPGGQPVRVARVRAGSLGLARAPETRPPIG